MARKFNSIHVIDSTMDDVAVRLSNCQLDKNWIPEESDKKFLKVRHNDIAKIMKLVKEAKPQVATFYLTKNNSNISVASDYLNFSTLKDQLKWWFAGYNKYVLSISCLDEDVLQITLFKKYKYITSFIAGKNLEDYNLKSTKFDSEEICKVFNVTPEQVEEAYSENLYETCMNFSKLFNLPLNIDVLQLISTKKIEVEVVSFYL